MTANTKPPNERPVEIDFCTGTITEGREFSDAEQADHDRHRVLLRLALKVEQGGELSFDERAMLAGVLRRDVMLEQMEPETLDARCRRLRDERSRDSADAISFLAHQQDLDDNDGARLAALVVGRSIVPRHGQKRVDEDVAFAMVRYFIARNHTVTTAIKLAAKELGKPQRTVQSQYYRRSRHRNR